MIIATQPVGHRHQVFICEECKAELRREGMKGLKWTHLVIQFSDKHKLCAKQEQKA